jgi:hypothetical protein
MGYYMRYIVTDTQDISLAVIVQALKQIDPAYAILTDFDAASGDLLYGEKRYGEIEINRPGDDIFEEEIADLRELLPKQGTADARRVLDALEKAKAMVAVNALWKGRNSEATLEKIDPLWDWLFDHYAGILQADNEGFYDASGLILESSLKI